MPNKSTIILTVILCLSVAFDSFGNTDTLNVQADSTEQGFYIPEHEYDFIVDDFTYDQVQDRLSCLQQSVPFNYNNRVHAFVNYFVVKNRDYTRLMLQRENVYFPIFEKYLKKYNLPDELKYLSIIESGLNPKAISRARAVGLWQFMSATGRHFKLHQDWYIDERMDPEKSTEAACRYMSQLYNMFGDWELVLAAYNSGPGNVRKAIRRSGYKKTFWEIYKYLPRETRSYVPQYVAIVYAMNYAEEHNIFIDDLDYPIESDTVLVNQYVHLETLSNLMNVCNDDLEKLNPGIKRKAVPSGVKKYPVNLPVDKVAYFRDNRTFLLDSAGKVGKEKLEKLAKNSPGNTYGKNRIVYRVRSGDVLGKIAMRYNVRVSDLKRWNNLRGNLIRVGQKLDIWLNPKAYKPSNRNNSTVAKATVPIPKDLPASSIYTVQAGDTLWDISRMFKGLTIEKIKELNNLTSDNLKVGQVLKVK
ncbi:MAG: LysM peptidoglycan-binding domain-containing protein [Bacteroidota bacterium]